MRYSHLIAKLLYEPTLLRPERLLALCHLLETRLAQGPPEPPPQSPPQSPPATVPDLAPEESEPDLRDGTAVIPVHGTIVPHPEDIAMSECGCSIETLRAAVEQAEADPRIRRILFDFRSPGGEVTGIPELARRIASLRKPTIAFSDSECCSGAIWLAEQCRWFYCAPSASVGSVGVYTLCLDESARLKRLGIRIEAVQAGKYKLLGAYWKPLADDERAILQARVDKIYGQFKQAMETWRVVSDRNFGNGLVFDGEEAAALGFTDGTCDSLEDALEIAAGTNG